MVHSQPSNLDLFDAMEVRLSYVLTIEAILSGFDAVVNISFDSLSTYAVFVFLGIYLILMPQVTDKPVPNRKVWSDTPQKYHFL